MGSGILKTLPSNEVPYDQFLYVFSHGSHSTEPCVCLLLWGLSGGSCNEGLFLIAGTSIVDYRVMSLTLIWVLPVLPLLVGCVPGVLRAVATQMSLFATGIALNFT